MKTPTPRLLPPLSPCTKVCKVDKKSGFCQGCYRTLGEIAEWMEASAQRKQDIVDASNERRISAPAQDSKKPSAG